MVVVFYAAGLIDRARLVASSVETQKTPFFFHYAVHFYDGGSVRYESFAYSALESRKREIVEHEDGTAIWGPGHQGFSWTWRHLNTLWILAFLVFSFLSVVILLRARKTAERNGDGKRDPCAS